MAMMRRRNRERLLVLDSTLKGDLLFDLHLDYFGNHFGRHQLRFTSNISSISSCVSIPPSRESTPNRTKTATSFVFGQLFSIISFSLIFVDAVQLLLLLLLLLLALLLRLRHQRHRPNGGVNAKVDYRFEGVAGVGFALIEPLPGLGEGARAHVVQSQLHGGVRNQVGVWLDEGVFAENRKGKVSFRPPRRFFVYLLVNDLEEALV